VDVVQFEQVSKQYTLGDHRNAREAIVAATQDLVRLRRRSRQEIWTLRDVTFTIADGEAVGVIGRNGAGKSTILKILTGITAPTAGVSRTRGRVAALLEVGTGFHQELTGRENIYLNGAILGMSRRDIGRAFDDIVEFSGVARFLDTPVKRYSSGMYMRLAFAVAAHLEPDILIVDEVLAVGDAEFQRKCLGRMEEAEREGRTVVFVSHDLASLSRICPRALWMEAGRVRATGPSAEVVRQYLSSGLVSATTGTALVRSGPLTLTSVRIGPADGPPTGTLMREEPVRIDVAFHVAEEVPGLDLAIYVTDHRGVRILDQALSETSQPRLPAGSYRAQVTVPPLLNVGDFTVGIWFGTAHAELLHEPAAASFTLHGRDRPRLDRVIVCDMPIVVDRLEQGAPGGG
jgi:ABC-type polysaccharide/polyol phosphate transport system ATPase subunit